MDSQSNPRTAVLVSLIFLLATSLLLSCSKDSNPATPSDNPFPESNVSYTRHVQPLFLSTCAVAGCHDDQSRQSALSLTTYENATARPGIIVPSNADASVLVQRIEGTLPPRMPFNRQPLNANQINGIKKWINEGAKNN
jgi:hypothetical protein